MSNNYLLDNTKNVNVLKDEFTFNYSDYQNAQIANEYNKVYLNSKFETDKSILAKEDKRIYNLSLKEIANNASTSYINIINDLSIYFNKNNNNWKVNEIGYIFTKNDNLVYVGLLLIILSFCLYLISISK